MELLTGKCLELFKQYLEKLLEDTHKGFWMDYDMYIDEIFNFLPFYMQYGVLEKFFDSIGMEIFIKGFKFYNEPKEYYFIITNEKITHLNNHLKNRKPTRLQCQVEAIKKANELYNIKLK